jgi:hypothetical protein
MGGRMKIIASAIAVLMLCWAQGAQAASPPQRLPSAVIVYPLIVVEGNGAITDTRIELVNLSNRVVHLGCIYVPAETCSGFDFHVLLTPNQPISWLASRGIFSGATAVPPFGSNGELKCIVEPNEEEVAAHNTIQGRAAVFGADGQTIGYSAVGFLRLTDGPLTNEIDLDGVTYTQCPDEQHFVFIASDPSTPAAESELVLAPCTEDLENLVTRRTVVQFIVTNEMEVRFSASTSVFCSLRVRLDHIDTSDPTKSIFSRAVLGSDTGHLVVRGAELPVLAMVVDRFLTPPAPATAGNEPALRGGRSAQIRIP